MNTTANTTRIRWWIAGLMWLAINYIDGQYYLPQPHI